MCSLTCIRILIVFLLQCCPWLLCPKQDRWWWMVMAIIVLSFQCQYYYYQYSARFLSLTNKLLLSGWERSQGFFHQKKYIILLHSFNGHTSSIRSNTSSWQHFSPSNSPFVTTIFLLWKFPQGLYHMVVPVVIETWMPMIGNTICYIYYPLRGALPLLLNILLLATPSATSILCLQLFLFSSTSYLLL